MNKDLQANNPIQIIAENTPPLVWAYNLGNLNRSINKLDINAATKANFTQTIRRYAEGARTAKALKTINIHLRKVIQATWPVKDALFEGNETQQNQEALSVAIKMTEDFENMFNQQKADVNNANINHTHGRLKKAS